MNLDVQLNNKTAEPIEKSLLESVVQETLSRTKWGRSFAARTVAVSVAVVSGEEIATINKTYRKKDAPTDVLSFGEFENQELLTQSTEDPLFLGELIVCPEYIHESARQQSVSFTDELIYITSHGILHLLGYDHGEAMFAIQDAVVVQLLKDKQ